MTSLLINEHPLQVLPTLAEQIGLNEAIFVQQVHYWMCNPKSGVEYNGRTWVWNNYTEWQEQFKFWSIRTIRRVVKSCLEKGILDVVKMNKNIGDRTNYYSIDYEKLSELENSISPINPCGIKLNQHKDNLAPREDNLAPSCGHIGPFLDEDNLAPSIENRDYTETSTETNVNPSPADADGETFNKIFTYWKKIHNKTDLTKFTEKRKRKIKTILKDYSPKEVCLAIKGCSLSDWHMGGNPSSTKYNDLLNILKDDSVIDRFIDLGLNGKPKREGVSDLPSDDNKLEAWAISAGGPKPKSGESYADYRNSLETFIRRAEA